MRNLIIAACLDLADTLGEMLAVDLNSLSNKELLELYTELVLDVYTDDE